MHPLFVISGPSGAGKSTVIRAIRQRLPGLGFSVSATTRSPRETELDGRHYHFVSEERFAEMIREGAFVEHIRREHCYGTLWSELERVREGPMVLDVDVAGARAIRERFPGAYLIFIAPPSLEELERRLRDRRDGMAETEIRSRLMRAEEELAKESLTLYDRVVVNNDREVCIAAVMTMIRSVMVSARENDN